MLGSYAIQFFDQTMCVSLWIRWLHCASFLTLAHCYQGSSLQGTKWKILGNTNSTNSTYFTQLFKQTIIDEKKNWEKTNDRYKRKRLYIAQNAYPYPVFARLQGSGAFQRNRTALQLKKKNPFYSCDDTTALKPITDPEQVFNQLAFNFPLTWKAVEVHLSREIWNVNKPSKHSLLAPRGISHFFYISCDWSWLFLRFVALPWKLRANVTVSLCPSSSFSSSYCRKGKNLLRRLAHACKRRSHLTEGRHKLRPRVVAAARFLR